MTGSGRALAAWHGQVNRSGAPQEMRHWLTDRVSLTVKLIAHSAQFRVQRLAQKTALCLADEYAEIGLARRQCVRERKVLLVCDSKPVVFAHTVVPLQADANDWPFFNSLGERSLGTTLFGDPLVQRGALQFARLPACHPLAVQARAVCGSELDANAAADVKAFFARRCLFRRRQGVLLVTEVFLPTIADLRLNQESMSPARYVGGNRFNSLATQKTGIVGKRI